MCPARTSPVLRGGLSREERVCDRNSQNPAAGLEVPIFEGSDDLTVYRGARHIAGMAVLGGSPGFLRSSGTIRRISYSHYVFECFSRYFAPDALIRKEQLLNVGIAAALLLAYILYLWFSVATTRGLRIWIA